MSKADGDGVIEHGNRNNKYVIEKKMNDEITEGLPGSEGRDIYGEKHARTWETLFVPLIFGVE
jgi:hypothetical protein